MTDQDTQNISSKASDWRIPRPLLYSSSNRTDLSSCRSNYERNIKAVYGFGASKSDKSEEVQIQIPNEQKWFSSGSSCSSSSRTVSSGSLLLSPSNLSHIETINVKQTDTQSIASSTHFTLINGVTIPRKPLSNCCTKSRQLTILVITMTFILFFGILAAILCIEMRAMELRNPD